MVRCHEVSATVWTIAALAKFTGVTSRRNGGGSRGTQPSCTSAADTERKEVLLRNTSLAGIDCQEPETVD